MFFLLFTGGAFACETEQERLKISNRKLVLFNNRAPGEMVQWLGLMYGNRNNWNCRYDSTFTSVDQLPSYEWVNNAASTLTFSEKVIITAIAARSLAEDAPKEAQEKYALLFGALMITPQAIDTEKLTNIFTMALCLLLQNVWDSQTSSFQSLNSASQKFINFFNALPKPLQDRLSAQMHAGLPHIQGNIFKVNLSESSLDLMVIELPPSVVPTDTTGHDWDFLPKVLLHTFPCLADNGKVVIEHIPYVSCDETMEVLIAKRLRNPFVASFLDDELEELAKHLETPKLQGPSRIFGIVVDHQSLEETLIFVKKVLQSPHDQTDMRSRLINVLRSKWKARKLETPISVFDKDLAEMFLINYWMFSKKYYMQKALEKVGYSNVMITQRTNSYNHRENAWIIEATKKAAPKHSILAAEETIKPTHPSTGIINIQNEDHDSAPSSKVSLFLFMIGLLNIAMNYWWGYQV